MNKSNKNKPIITRAPPPVPKSPPTIADDLLLIDFSDSSPQKSSAKPEPMAPFDRLLTPPPAPLIEPPRSSPPIQQRFSTHAIDSQQFVAKVVAGVTEQLKHDFPRIHSSQQEFTPPLVRRFTVPYPSSSYYNVHRPH